MVEFIQSIDTIGQALVASVIIICLTFIGFMILLKILP